METKNYKTADGCQIENLNEIYLEYFGYRTDGVFVNVGAYNGYDFDNTWGLAEAGWHGLCIEAIPEFAKACEATHKDNNVLTMNTAVGSFTGNIDMHFAGTLSTYDKAYIRSEVWKQYYSDDNMITVPIDTLDNILFELDFVNQGFELLSIDTEGSELEVLQGFYIDFWKPKMIIVEEHATNEHRELAVLVPYIEEYLRSYRKIYAGFVNSVYVL